MTMATEEWTETGALIYTATDKKMTEPLVPSNQWKVVEIIQVSFREGCLAY